MEYSKLVGIYQSLSETTKMLEKRAIITEFLKDVEVDEIEASVLLLEGRLFPESDKRKIGIGTQLILKSISKVSGKTDFDLNNQWAKLGDLGLVSEKNMSSLTQGKLTIKQVFNNLRKLSEISGSGSTAKKIGLISKLLESSNGVGSKYLVRTCLEDLRTGAGFGILRDAVADAFDVDVKNVQKAYDLTTDLSRVAIVAKTKGDLGLEKISLNIGTPIKVMLFKKVESVEEGFEVVGSPAIIDYKYDGFRLQIHRLNNEFKLFTRNLEDVTTQFPDIIDLVKKDIKSKTYIIDCEVVGYDNSTKRWKPFQEISQRIKRKYRITEMIKEVPVMIFAFDLIGLNGKNLIDVPFKDRREKLAEIINETPFAVSLAKEITTSSIEKSQKFYEEALRVGAEGVMMKNLEGVYKPGSRVGFGVKIKPVMETLDLVIVGGEWGTGKRANWISSFILACRTEDGFEEIGKIGTGFKEKDEMGVSFDKMTKLLKPFIIGESGRDIKIKPGVIIEVKYEEIQKSPTYGSGYALRFPRFVRLREDKNLKDVDNLKRILKLSSAQRGRK